MKGFVVIPLGAGSSEATEGHLDFLEILRDFVFVIVLFLQLFLRTLEGVEFNLIFCIGCLNVGRIWLA